MSSKYLERVRTVQVLAPVANAFAGTIYTDVVQIKDYEVVEFVINIGVGTTGTSTLTVQATDNFTPSNRTPVSFHYRQELTAGTDGALTSATSAGFTTTAGSNKVIKIEVRAEDVVAEAAGTLAAVGVQIKAVEVAAAAVLGGAIANCFDGTYQGADMVSPLA